MKKIKLIKTELCLNSPFIKPKRVYYVQSGIEKTWDIVDSHDSVAVLLYHPKKDSFVLVKQFRPSIYMKNHDGFTYELCAGIMDKEKTPAQTIIEEIEEETGYIVKLEELEKIASFYTAVGFAGGRQTLFFATVDDTKRAHEGGGVDLEEIEVVYFPREEIKTFMLDENIATTSGLMFALMWFFHTKEKDFIKN